MSATTIPWNVSIDGFPENGSVEEQLRYLVRFAVLAPSSHNTQPWAFRVAGDTVELFSDRTRSLPVTDPEDRELTISCGAALLLLRLAMRYYGRRDETVLLPDPERPTLLARVRRGAPYEPTREECRLFEAIPHRHCHRSDFEPREVPERLLNSLERATEVEGARVHLVTDAKRRLVAGLVADADHIQGGDPAFRRELARWVHPNHTELPDGVPGYAFGMGELTSLLGPLFIANVNWGAAQAREDRHAAEESPVLAVLETPHNSPLDWLLAGEALARMLLAATAAGVSASFLNQPVQVLELRPHLARILGLAGYPQLVIRLGYGSGDRPTPRRAAEEVLTD